MIVEDGTGMTDSDSYVSVVFADNYFSSRGITEWNNLETEQKEQALIKGTDYVDNSFKWYGTKLNAEQSLRFPRENIFEYDGTEIKGIPNVLKQAVCDASLVVSRGTELFQTKNENGIVTSETIGELSFSYQNDIAQSGQTLYDSINTRLRGLFIDMSKNRILTGKVVRV